MAPKRAATKTASSPKAKAAPAGGEPDATTSTASSSGSNHMHDLAQAGGNRAIQVRQNIDSLLQQQQDMRANRRKLTQDLKNAKKKKARLQQRARLLTTEELLTVVALREGNNYKAANLYGGSQDGDSDTPGGEPVATVSDLIDDPSRQVEQSVAEGEPVPTPE
jgi:hypothetical protein